MFYTLYILHRQWKMKIWYYIILNKIVLNKIEHLSANWSMLLDQSRWAGILNYLKEINTSIICLQDTHLLECDFSF